MATLPVAPAAVRALGIAFASKVSPTSGGSTTWSGSATTPARGEKAFELPQLVRIAGREYQVGHGTTHRRSDRLVLGGA